jgi:hypothetical protein
MSRSQDPTVPASSASASASAGASPTALARTSSDLRLRGVEIVGGDGDVCSDEVSLYRAGHGVIDQDQGVRVRWLWVGRPWATALFLGATLWGAFWVLTASLGIGALLWPSAVVAVALYFATTQVVNETTVAVKSDTLVASHGPLPIRGTVQLGIDEVKSLDVVARRAPYASQYVVVATLHSGEEWELLWCGDREVADLVVETIRASLARRAKRLATPLP